MACSPKEEITTPDVTIETVANTIDETTADFLKKLTTQEALVDTKATDDVNDTKEINTPVDGEDNVENEQDSTVVKATAHIVTEYFTDGTYVTHKTYKADGVTEDETQVVIHKPKEDNIVRLSDGLHKIVEKPKEETTTEVKKEENKETDKTSESTEPTTKETASDGKFDTDKVIVEKEIIPDDKIEYEEITVEKKEFDDAVEENADRKETFAEGNKDTEEKQEIAVKNTIGRVSQTVEVSKNEPKEDKKEEENKETTVNTEEAKTEESKQNENPIIASNNSNKQSNDNSSNSSKANQTPKQTQTAKQNQSTSTVHQHNWVAQYKTVHHDEVSHTETYTVDVPVQKEAWSEGYATITNDCTGKVLKVFTGRDAYTKACEYQFKVRRDTDGCLITAGGADGILQKWTEIEHQTKTKKVVDKAAYDEKVLTGYKCSSCGATK